MQVVDALVDDGLKPVSLEDLLDDLALVGAHVKAMWAASGSKRNRFADGAFVLVVNGLWLHEQGIVAQFVNVLRDLDVIGVEFESMGQSLARGTCIAAEPGFGRSFNERRDGVTAGQVD